MNKIFVSGIVFLFIFYSQIASASSYNDGFYSSSSPATASMKTNDARLKKSFENYDAEFTTNIDALKKSMLKQQNDYSIMEYQSPINANPMNNQMQNNSPQNYMSPNPYLQQQKQPSWWRQENSFQGWGFD